MDTKTYVFVSFLYFKGGKRDAMKIHKKYNNNVVQTYDEYRNELIVIGSGIAYERTVGSWIDERKIEKNLFCMIVLKLR